MSRPAPGEDLDQDALDAGVELVGRTGAKSFEVGYVNEEPPPLRHYLYGAYVGWLRQLEGRF